MNNLKVTSKKFFLGLIIILLVFTLMSLVSASSFTVFNKSNEGITYFTVNGSSGLIGIGTGIPLAKLHVNGSAIFNGTINMDGNKVIGLANGTSAQDAVTKSQLDAVSSGAAGSYVLKSGDTMTGDLRINSGTTPTLFFDSAGTGDFAIRANGEHFEIYEPEDSNKIHLKVIDDGGVNAVYGLKTGTGDGTMRIDASGVGSFASGTIVSGNLGATQYCDETGSNCKDIVNLPSVGGSTASEYLLNLESDELSVGEIAAAMGTSTSGITKCDDPTAPVPGCFEVTGGKSLTGSRYWKVDSGTEYIFEVWVKVEDGAGDTSTHFYAGWEMYNSAKTSYGNVQRYWGSSGEQFDEDSRNDGEWYLVRGKISGVGGSTGNFISGTEYAKLYVNGEYDHQKSYTSYTFNQNIDIGRHADGNYYWNGDISGVKIYNRALSEDEIKLLYDKGR